MRLSTPSVLRTLASKNVLGDLVTIVRTFPPMIVVLSFRHEPSILFTHTLTVTLSTVVHTARWAWFYYGAVLEVTDMASKSRIASLSFGEALAP